VVSPHGVEVSGISYSYPDGREALRDVSFQVGAGERVAILGPNGAGKTTLALHLNGILGEGLGTVRVDGLEVAEENLLEVRRRVGMVFQDPSDQLFMPSVAEDVAFGPANLGLAGEELKAVVAGALDRVGASDLSDRVPHHLSGGERRRVSIAGVLAMNPTVLVLDEPASGMDPAGRRELIETLLGLELTQILVTHDLAMAAEVCHRALLMDAGRIVADGPTHAILADEALLEAHRLELPWHGIPRPD
jgi:cobalt/nickel transport system ATP-binding protein